MRFRLSAPGNCNKFFCICVVTKNKKNIHRFRNLPLPEIESLCEEFNLVPTDRSCCSESTLFIISAEKPLNFAHFENIVNDIEKFDLRATFGGAKKNDCFCIPPSSICARSTEILSAKNCVKAHLKGTYVYINDRCVYEGIKQKLEHLSKKYGFHIIYTKHSRNSYSKSRVDSFKGGSGFERVWSEWKNCEDDNWEVWPNFSSRRSCEDLERRELSPSYEGMHCEADCEDGWVEETWSLPCEKQQRSCDQIETEDLDWDQDCDWNHEHHRKDHCSDELDHWGNSESDDEGFKWDECHQSERKRSCHMKSKSWCDWANEGALRCSDDEFEGNHRQEKNRLCNVRHKSQCNWDDEGGFDHQDNHWEDLDEGCQIRSSHKKKDHSFWNWI